MPTLKQIQYFLAVAEYGGFTFAAETLHVAQPALSRQVAMLEDEIGVSLFERSQRGASLTEAGKHFREKMLTVQHLLDSGCEESRLISSGEAGVLRVLHSSSIPINVLMPSIKQFTSTNNAAWVEIDVMSSDKQIAEIASRKADVGFIRHPVLTRDPMVRLISFSTDSLYVAVPAGHGFQHRHHLELNELAKETFVSSVHLGRGGLARLMSDLCLQRGFTPLRSKVVTRKASILNLVDEGYGIAIVPEAMRSIPSNCHFIPLKDRDAFSEVSIAVHVESRPLVSNYLNAALDLG